MAFTAAFGIGAAPKDGALMTLMLMDPGPNDFLVPRPRSGSSIACSWQSGCRTAQTSPDPAGKKSQGMRCI